MSLNYAKSHMKHLEATVRSKGSTFAALYDTARWYDLSEAQCEALAEACGVALTEGQRYELKEQRECAHFLDGLTRGEEPKAIEQQAQPAKPIIVLKSYTPRSGA